MLERLVQELLRFGASNERALVGVFLDANVCRQRSARQTAARGGAC